ncbi:MAG: alpha-ketoglutarate-dependent dioxygenase AlkB [Parvularcula sp.]
MRQALSPEQATSLAQTVWELAEQTGWLSPVTPGGKPFSVRQTNFGPLGWISDAQGYRYVATDPRTGQSWQEIPAALRMLWKDLIGTPDVECCLVNHYAPTARMGLHRDSDEANQKTPIVSLSLGQPARFRLGTEQRSGKTQSIVVNHGDVLVLAGRSRRAYHGIDRVLPPDLLSPAGLPFDGRLNVTLRRVSLSV